MTADNPSLPDTSEASLAQARAEYQEYFAVRDELEINVIPMAPDASLPTDDDFLQQAPAVFRLASELQGVDPTALAQLRSLGNAAQIIADVLNQQNRKLSALLSYLLRNEDEPEHRALGFEYGGAGVGFCMQKPIALGQLVEIKIFLPDESTAVYCIGQIIECDEAPATSTSANADAPMTSSHTDDVTNPSSSASGYRLKALFQRISDSDRELLIRACMHAQSRLLKKRANARQDSP